MTGNHYESDVAEVTSRQTSPVTLCRFALLKKSSIVLGGCSALLALLGFRVRCACCSVYLRQRNYSRFETSHCLGIAERVVYSTINKLGGDSRRAKGSQRRTQRELGA